MAYNEAGALPEKVILASGSPRRRELLGEMGISFEIDVPDVDETVDGKPGGMVAVLAERKARAVAERRKNGLIIAADTLVALDEKALGKPVDEQDARDMLHALSGRTHDVFTGVCVLDAKSGRCIVDAVRSGVQFREVTDEEIDEYIATGEPSDKAGAYAIQGIGGKFVKGFEGSWSNIVGLPVERLTEMLHEINR
ncbi:MAG: septum formation protein Maf [Clostridia bacterium]|nr:septum formation protein Maf [Clostridia bacterium]